jgi:predicted nucleic acid-binding Zn ribbon protein
VSEEIMRRRKQQAQLQSIGEVLFLILKRKGMTSKLEENTLRKLWPIAVGSQIASQTQPDSFRNGTLFVKTVSSVWVQQLHFIKEEILDKLNQLSGKTTVKEIRFIVGHKLVAEKGEEIKNQAKRITLKKRDKEMIAECTEALADSELADVLKRVMRAEISRRRQMENEKAH